MVIYASIGVVEVSDPLDSCGVPPSEVIIVLLFDEEVGHRYYQKELKLKLRWPVEGNVLSVELCAGG